MTVGRERIRALAGIAGRVALSCLILITWWQLASRNERLRGQERTAVARGALHREIRTLRLVVQDSLPELPQPGAGDAAWWRDRIAREAKRIGVTVARSEAKPARLAIGPHPLERRELVVTGLFEAMLKLFGWLETSVPRTRIEEFVLEPISPDQVRATATVLVPGPAARR